MQPEAKKYLYDIEQACAALMSFTEGKTLDDYNDSLMLSISLPNRSSRYGLSEPMGNMSMIEPRMATSPCSITWETNR